VIRYFKFSLSKRLVEFISWSNNIERDRRPGIYEVGDLKNVCPATKHGFENRLFFKHEHQLDRSHPDAAWLCKDADCTSVGPTCTNTNVSSRFFWITI
jgi:hypothetical protein